MRVGYPPNYRLWPLSPGLLGGIDPSRKYFITQAAVLTCIVPVLRDEEEGRKRHPLQIISVTNRSRFCNPNRANPPSLSLLLFHLFPRNNYHRRDVDFSSRINVPFTFVLSGHNSFSLFASSPFFHWDESENEISNVREIRTPAAKTFGAASPLTPSVDSRNNKFFSNWLF